MALNLKYAKGDGVTISTTEISLNSGTSTLSTITDGGVFSVVIDPSAMQLGDVYVFKIYETASSSAAKLPIFSGVLSNAQTELYTHPGLPLGLGWDMTLTKSTGTDRAFNWTIRRASSS